MDRRRTREEFQKNRAAESMAFLKRMEKRKKYGNLQVIDGGKKERKNDGLSNPGEED